MTTLIQTKPVAAPVARYEFHTVTADSSDNGIWRTVTRTWKTTLAAVIAGLVAALFLVTPVLQMRSQTVVAQQLQQRFTTAAGAAGATDLSPLPNEPLALGTPVALLQVPSLGISQVVVEGASGAQLSGGPGHVPGTAGIAERGTSVIAGRRATWGAPFAKVPTLKVGDELRTTTVAGTMTYRVSSVSSAMPDLAGASGSAATLVLATSTPAGIASGDVFVTAVSTRPAFMSTPQNRLPDTGLRGAPLSAALPFVGWLAALVLMCALARSWVASNLMDRVLAWSIAAPVVGLLGLLALRALAALLPATL